AATPPPRESRISPPDKLMTMGLEPKPVFVTLRVPPEAPAAGVVMALASPTAHAIFLNTKFASSSVLTFTRVPPASLKSWYTVISTPPMRRLRRARYTNISIKVKPDLGFICLNYRRRFEESRPEGHHCCEPPHTL